jgi:hypoxanthine phosphoribosyltransferase
MIPQKAHCSLLAFSFHYSRTCQREEKLNQRLKYPYEFIGDILITQDQIEERVAEIGAQITEDYQNSEKLLLLGLLRGSVMFMTDLMRSIRRPMTMDFMLVSSYSGTDSTGFVRIDSDHKSSIEGWDVIMVDDIVDTGLTLHTVRKLLIDRKPHSLKICTLLDKVARHKVDLDIDYCGFEIPDYFVVGYGLDIDEKGRNLPYIASVDLDKYHQLYG